MDAVWQYSFYTDTLDGDGPHPPTARQARGRSRAPAPHPDRVGRRLPLRAMSRAPVSRTGRAIVASGAVARAASLRARSSRSAVGGSAVAPVLIALRRVRPADVHLGRRRAVGRGDRRRSPARVAIAGARLFAARSSTTCAAIRRRARRGRAAASASVTIATAARDELRRARRLGQRDGRAAGRARRRRAASRRRHAVTSSPRSRTICARRSPRCRLLAEAIERRDRRRRAARARTSTRMRTHLIALSALIDDLFELSRLEAGDITWSLAARVALDELVAGDDRGDARAGRALRACARHRRPARDRCTGARPTQRSCSASSST